MKRVAPTVTVRPDGEELHEHDAYGVICVSHVRGGIGTLCGSELNHQSVISLKIRRARSYRSLSNTGWSPRESIVEVYLSADQWARMVASTGHGEGTPVTLVRAPAKGTPLEQVAQLEAPNTNEVFKREAKRKVQKAVEAAKKAFDALEALQTKKTISKKDLQSIMNDLSYATHSLPANLGFIEDMFTEHMEKSITAAKSEIEAFVQQEHLKIGLKVAKAALPQETK